MTISVVSSVAVVVLLAVIGVVICILMFVGANYKRKRAALLQNDYDDIHLMPQLPQNKSDEQQIDGRQESSIDVLNSSPFANEGEPAENNSDTRADFHMQMDENSAYQPSTNFVFATNPVFGTNAGTAPDIEFETEGNAT